MIFYYQYPLYILIIFTTMQLNTTHTQTTTPLKDNSTLLSRGNISVKPMGIQINKNEYKIGD